MKSSIKYLKILINFISMAFLLFACIYILPRMIMFFMPFVVAFIISLIANPLVRFLDKKMKIKRKAGSVVVIVLVLAVVLLACYGVVYVIVSQGSAFVTNLPYIWSKINSAFGNIEAGFGKYFARMPISVKEGFAKVSERMSESISGWAGTMGESAAQYASDSLRNLPLIVVGIVMGVLASYSFVAERDNVSEFVKAVIPQSVRERFDLVSQTMKNAVGGYFKAQLKIMGYVYLVLLIGLLILRVPYAVVVALLIALLDFLPFFGTGTVMWPWAVISFVQKDYRMAVGMMIVWGVSQLVRQLIQPKLLGDSVGMPAIPTLLLLYVGFRVSGAVGLIVAVPVGMIVYNLFKAGVFSNFLYSTRILAKDMKKLRVFSDEELIAEGITPSETGAGINRSSEEKSSENE